MTRESDPPYPDPIDWPKDEVVGVPYFGKVPHGVELHASRRLQHLPLNLFEDVSVDFIAGNFSVPRRYIESARDGVWLLDVFAKRFTPKEPKDYGNQRFTSDGHGFWVPHLYPFEETDHRGLPNVLDQQRALMTVRLQSASTEPYPISAEIHTSRDLFGASEDVAYYNGEGLRYFEEFLHLGHALKAIDLQYDTEEGVFANLSWEGKVRSFQATDDMLDESIARAQAHHEKLTTLEHTTAFGQIAVPLRALSRGAIHASIQFPELME